MTGNSQAAAAGEQGNRARLPARLWRFVAKISLPGFVDWATGVGEMGKYHFSTSEQEMIFPLRSFDVPPPIVKKKNASVETPGVVSFALRNLAITMQSKAGRS